MIRPIVLKKNYQSLKEFYIRRYMTDMKKGTNVVKYCTLSICFDRKRIANLWAAVLFWSNMHFRNSNQLHIMLLMVQNKLGNLLNDKYFIDFWYSSWFIWLPVLTFGWSAKVSSWWKMGRPKHCWKSLLYQ